MRFFSRHLIFKSPLDAVSTHSSNQFADYFPAPAHNESVRGPQTSSSFRIADNSTTNPDDQTQTRRIGL
jgi:hypothetical protein